MSRNDASDGLIASLSAEVSRGDGLRDAGRFIEALEAWDEVCEQASELVGTRAAAVSGLALGRKAHLLLSLQRAPEAARVAAEAVKRLSAVPGHSAMEAVANAQGVRRAALTDMGQLDAALEIDGQLCADYGYSELFEFRLIAGRALGHEIWIHGHRRDDDRAVQSARRLLALFADDDDPTHVVDVVELLLSGAEALNHRRIWRRASAQTTDQAYAICDQVFKLAKRVGGDLGEAAAVNARLTLADAHVQNHRLRASVKVKRPPLSPTALIPLEQMEQAAQAAGSEQRHLNLVMIRATTLAEAGKTNEALAILDELLTNFNVRGSMLNATGPTAVKAMRKVIASKR